MIAGWNTGTVTIGFACTEDASTSMWTVELMAKIFQNIVQSKNEISLVVCLPLWMYIVHINWTYSHTFY